MIQRHRTAASFSVASGPFLVEREAEHNLILGLSSNLIRDEARGVPAEPSPYFATVARGGQVVGAAIMTPPWNLVISTVSEADLADVTAALAVDVASFETPPPGVLGPIDSARAFADAWCRDRRLATRVTMRERIYRLERLIEPPPIAGRSRIATVDDRAVLHDMITAFMREALGRHDDDYAREVVDRGLDLGQRTFYLWEDGGVVSLAASGGTTPNGIRLGPVYTPPRLRGRGYASAVTAAASRAELAAGRRFIFLFTDLANPTSNKIYQAIGYEPVIDIDQLVFEPSA